jgi:hypothetical protein
VPTSLTPEGAPLGLGGAVLNADTAARRIDGLNRTAAELRLDNAQLRARIDAKRAEVARQRAALEADALELEVQRRKHEGACTTTLNALEGCLAGARAAALAGMTELFPIAANAVPHTICQRQLPQLEAQTPEHACALGLAAHALVTLCAIYGYTPMHPISPKGSASTIAEHPGAGPARIYPLYPVGRSEREKAQRAVLLLRRVVGQVASAVLGQRMPPELPLAVALNRLLHARPPVYGGGGVVAAGTAGASGSYQRSLSGTLRREI